jgi:hypothetical protein
MTVKELKKGEFFTRKAVDEPKENQVFIRGTYDRETKRYECLRFSDMNDTIYLKGSTTAYTDFIF